MISRYTHKNLTWVDLEKPSKEEVLAVMQEFKINSKVGEELIGATVHSKAELHNNSIYLILKFPDGADNAGQPVEKEVDFVIGKDFIITAHYDTFDPIYEFKKMFEVSSILSNNNFGDHAGYLFYSMIKIIYSNLNEQLYEINDTLKRIERKIFEDQEEKMVKEISQAHRRILDIKQAIRFHGEILKSFEAAGKRFFGEDFSYYLESITSEYQKVANTLEGHKEILKDLKDTNDSLLTTKTNEVMKVLTFITFTILPFTLTTGILGMNIPLTENVGVGAIIIIFSLALSVGVCVFAYFRKRKWL